MPKIYPEDREAAKAAFDRAKGDSTDTASLFEVVDALRELGIEADSDQLYKENKSWDVNFERFCDIYENKKEEKDKVELKLLVTESFEALGGKPNQQGVIDMQKLSDVFKFFEFDLDVEDFLSRAQFDTSSNILFDDYFQLFDMNAGHQ